MRKLFMLPVILVFCYCNSPEQNNTTSGTKAPASPDTADATSEDLSGCYLQVIARDSFTAKLQQQGEKVSGQLTFDNFEKDGSTGTVSGRVEGDIIRLLYTFRSEGTTSVMDVYFKRSGNALIRGIGEMQTRGDTAFFVKPEAVEYPQTGRLLKVSCQQLPARYQ